MAFHEAADPPLCRRGEEEEARRCRAEAIDLGRTGTVRLEKLEEIEPRQLQEKAVELAASEDVPAPTSTTALPTAQIDQGGDVVDLQVAPSEEANIEQVHPRTPRMRRGGAETLPRGQRWKRRLPEVLRRGT